MIGTDVAASNDFTGNANQGCDWLLEARTGEIEAVSMLSSEGQLSYNGVLTTMRVGIFSANGGINGTERHGGRNASA